MCPEIEATVRTDDKTSALTTLRRMLALAAAAAVVAAPVGALRAAPAAHAPAAHGGACVMADDAAVAALFAKWNLALASLDAAQVAALYWDDAVLLPTVSNIPRTDTASITDYFEHFLKKFPRGTIVRRITHHACGISVDAGVYDFSVMDPSGQPSTVSARYTFVYTYRDGAWRIQHHHSSAMPERTTPQTAASEHTAPEHTAPEHTASEHTATASASSAAPTTEDAGKPAAAPQKRPRIQLAAASRMPWSFLSAEQRRAVGRETVGLKVCAAAPDGERSFTVSDAAPHAEANEAALAWAKAARWSVSDAPPGSGPICAQVVVRFTDAGL